MSRAVDLNWFDTNRAELAAEYRGRWLVVYQGDLIKDFTDEEEAVSFAIERYGVDTASVFLAVPKDPFVYIG